MKRDRKGVKKTFAFQCEVLTTGNKCHKLNSLKLKSLNAIFTFKLKVFTWCRLKRRTVVWRSAVAFDVATFQR